MKIKICGITNLADARFAAGAGADFLGFIQAPESPRYIDPQLVAEISAWVFGALSVGVFVDEDPDEINRIAEVAGFDYVQLHGNETVETCRLIERPLIKAFRVTESVPTASIRRESTHPEHQSKIDLYSKQIDLLRREIEPFRPHVDYMLLDSGSPVLKGGTGKAFPWEIACALATEFPIFLAGGLGPDNVDEAIRLVRPEGIDASSRLEESAGVKDFDLISAFIEHSRAASEELAGGEKGTL